MSETDNFVEVNHARSEDQKDVLKQIIADGRCPFCKDMLRHWHKKRIIAEDEHWILTPSQWPYANTKAHLLLISKTHCLNISDLPVEAGASLWKFATIVEETYEMESGALFIRFGNPKFNGGSVHHLHVHIIAPDLEGDWDKIKVKLGANPNKNPPSSL